MRQCDWDGYASREALVNAVFLGERELFNVCGEGDSLLSLWRGKGGEVYAEILLPVEGKPPLRYETKAGLGRDLLLEILVWFESGKDVGMLPGSWRKVAGERAGKNFLLMGLVVFLIWGLFRWIQG